METKIRLRSRNCFFNMITEDVGTYEFLEDASKEGYIPAQVSSHISEYDFYRCFLWMKSSLAKSVYDEDDSSDSAISGVNIDYMAAIMSKGMDFTMPANSKNSVQKKLAEELGRTAKSAYSAINRLKNAGYLQITEDNLIVPNPELQTLRKVTKNHLEKVGCFPISYMLNFMVCDPRYKNGSKQLNGKETAKRRVSKPKDDE